MNKRTFTTLIASAAATLIAVAPAQAAPATVPSTQQKAFNFTSWTPGGYASGSAEKALQQLSALGTDRIVLTPTYYMDSATSDTIAADPAKTPTDASLRTVMGRAHDLGMSVVIKPHVDVKDGTFRGDIHPADQAAWFASYRAVLTHYADLAQSAGADTLVVGTELTSTNGDTAAWDALIATARSHFSGTLTYAANWADGADAIGFWDKLDAIGIDAYMPLQTSGTATVASLVSAWTPYVQQISELHARTGKPVMFTELGYQSRSGALASPASASGSPDANVQALAYTAALQVWSAVPWFQGIAWWNMEAEPTGENPAGTFSIVGKPAAAVLRAAQGGTGVAASNGGPGTETAGMTVPLGAGVLILLALGAATMLFRRRPAAPKQNGAPLAPAPSPRPTMAAYTPAAPRPVMTMAAAPAPAPRPTLVSAPTTFGSSSLPPQLAAACMVPSPAQAISGETRLPSRYHRVAA
jgi:hypothetical protein